MQVIFEKPEGRDNALVARLSGAVNALTAGELWELISGQLDDEIRFVVLDLTGVTMLTSNGIGILVRLYTRLNALEGGVAVYGCNSKIREIFTIVMLHEVLKVRDTEAEAWQALES